MMDEKTKQTIIKLRELVDDQDIPSPTCPEYIEHHISIKKILKFIDENFLEVKPLSLDDKNVMLHALRYTTENVEFLTGIGLLETDLKLFDIIKRYDGITENTLHVTYCQETREYITIDALRMHLGKLKKLFIIGLF